MSRVEGWEAILQEQIVAAQGRKFDWSGWTCCDFCAQIVALLRGEPDLRSRFPTFRTASEARSIIESHGNIESLVATVMGPSKPIKHVGRGDVVLLLSFYGTQPGICDGALSYTTGRRGLVKTATRAALCAWTV